MCTTNQYLYVCAHPASYRFRTSICRNPASTLCHIRDGNSVLPYRCTKCEAKASTRNARQATERARQRTDINIMVAKNTWHVPSRCFIDIGFQNLDPFGVGNQKKKVEQADPRPTLSPITRVPSTLDGKRASRIVADPPRQPSPCCLKGTKMGAYQATRLEGVEDRQRGKIMDSFCRSCL